MIDMRVINHLTAIRFDAYGLLSRTRDNATCQILLRTIIERSATAQELLTNEAVSITQEIEDDTWARN